MGKSKTERFDHEKTGDNFYTTNKPLLRENNYTLHK